MSWFGAWSCEGSLTGCRRGPPSVVIMGLALPDLGKSTSTVNSDPGEAAGQGAAGSFTHVLRGRDVRDSLWETCWTLPLPLRVLAGQVYGA